MEHSLSNGEMNSMLDLMSAHQKQFRPENKEREKVISKAKKACNKSKKR